MSDPIQDTPEALLAEVQTLRTKNVELLAELKAAKTGRTDTQAELAALQAERDAALAEVRSLRLDGPVAATLADIAIDAELFGQLFGRHYTFALNDSGAIVITNAEGTPAMVTEPDAVSTGGNKRHEKPREVRTPGKARPARFDADDIRALALATADAEKFKHMLPHRASGGGADGRPGLPAAQHTTKPTPEQPAPSPYGLR